MKLFAFQVVVEHVFQLTGSFLNRLPGIRHVFERSIGLGNAHAEGKLVPDDRMGEIHFTPAINQFKEFAVELIPVTVRKTDKV